MPTANPKRLGDRLREIREEADLSQLALAKAIGLKRSAISRIETGARQTTPDKLYAWFEACGYHLEAVRVGDSSRTRRLAEALAGVDNAGLDLAERFLRLWPQLDEVGRGLVEDDIGSYERRLLPKR